MPNERWMPVVGHPGYEVSDLGRIRSTDRVVETRTGPRRYRGKVLKPNVGTHGYPYVIACDGQTRTTLFLHCAVMRAFVGPPGPGQEVRHRKNTRSDVGLANLRYGTRAENMADCTADGTMRNGTEDQTHCLRAHELTGDNLVVGALPRRACRSCSCARGYLRRRGDFTEAQLQAVADRYYATFHPTAPTQEPPR